MCGHKPGIALPESLSKVSICLVALLILVFESCRTEPPDRQAGMGLDLTERFELASGERAKSATRKAFTPHVAVVRRGQRRDVMVLVAPVVIRASLAGISGRVCLTGFAAPVFNIGDGIQMDVWLVGAGPEQRVYSRYFDPARLEQDRAWIPFEIPMELDGTAERPHIEIRVAGGPQGDHTADWLGVSSPTVSRFCSQK